LSISIEEFGKQKFAEVNGKRMAYIDEGAGSAIVFQHGNPTSSYLWRNVMPHCAGLGRLIACDLIGMGGSEKLSNSGPDRYGYQEQREFLFGLWNKLNLGNDVILVIHDWGSALGFDWARQNPKRVKGIVYMEAIVKPVTWQDWPENARKVFQGFRSDRGDALGVRRRVSPDNPGDQHHGAPIRLADMTWMEFAQRVREDTPWCWSSSARPSSTRIRTGTG